MVEAIASSTGWIPYIFHNLQFVEGQVNQTLVTSKDGIEAFDFPRYAWGDEIIR